MGRPANTPERLLRLFVNKTATCWLWTGCVASNGYGKVRSMDRYTSPHRVIAAHFHGPTPKGMQVDHLCRNRLCVNPEHLEIVTPRTNTLRSDAVSAKNARKVVCMRGHALSGENLYMTTDNRRQCRTCRNVSTAAYQARRAV